MRKIERKMFPVWNFDKEEEYLNGMAEQGWALVSVGFCRYEFEKCQPGEYTVRLELLEEMPKTEKSQQYIAFMESTGAEFVASYTPRWVYFRKKKELGEFEIYSDAPSRLKHLNRVRKLVTALSIISVANGVNNIVLATNVSPLSFMNALLGGWCLLLGVLGLKGQKAIGEKCQKLEAEASLFEQ